jgi:sulfur relay (sulfurtransferase) complex TusBCD TusD component (DsrE family)
MAATAAAPACVYCSWTTHLVQGDGPVVVCRACMGERGAAADDPTSVNVTLLRQLRRRHRAVVALSEAKTGYPAWSWIAEWPGAKT